MSTILQLDDLKVGQWVIIHSFRDNEPIPSNSPFPGMVAFNKRRPAGNPLRIVAINLPFLFVWSGQEPFTVDVRDVYLQKANRSYVNSYMRLTESWTKPLTPTQRGAMAQATANLREMRCPKCGGKLESELRDDVEIVFCPRCHIYSNPVPTNN